MTAITAIQIAAQRALDRARDASNEALESLRWGQTQRARQMHQRATRELATRARLVELAG